MVIAFSFNDMKSKLDIGMKILSGRFKIYNAMDKPKELPGKKTPKVEEPHPKKSSPPAPVVETPDPPEVVEPTTPPAIERKPSTPPGKRKRNNLKHFVKLDY